MFKWLNKIRLKSLPTKTDNDVLVVDSNGDIGVNTNLHKAYHGYTKIWILPSDFVSDKGNLIYDTGGVIDKTTSAVIYAHVLIPSGATATNVTTYGSGDDATVIVYKKTPSAATETSKGTGGLGDAINITDVSSTDDDGAYLAIKITPGDQDADRIYGGLVILS